MLFKSVLKNYDQLVFGINNVHTVIISTPKNSEVGETWTYKRISSTRLPNVMFSRAPIVSPARAAIASVASVRRADNGIMAMALQIKTKRGFASNRYDTIPAATNTSSPLTHGFVPNDNAEQPSVSHGSRHAGSNGTLTVDSCAGVSRPQALT
jgi:hypothetical protein